MSDQPEALYLAEVIEHDPQSKSHHDAAAACLRRQHAEIEALKAERNALRAELREATEAIDDPAVNNLRTLAESIRMMRAKKDALREALKDIADDYEERFDMNSPSTNPGIKNVVEAVRAALKETK